VFHKQIIPVKRPNFQPLQKLPKLGTAHFSQKLAITNPSPNAAAAAAQKLTHTTPTNPTNPAQNPNWPQTQSEHPCNA
jgi:hypothetical protein